MTIGQMRTPLPALFSALRACVFHIFPVFSLHVLCFPYVI